MGNPNQRLILTLGLGWLAFLALGLGLRQGLRSPGVTVIIDRSYCSPAQWQGVAQAYADLYDQDQQQRISLDQVIYVSDLGQEAAPQVPTPEQVQALNTYGRFNPSQLEAALSAQPQSRVLSCHRP
ncbi:MAG: hypothetical protein ACKO63_18370 [Nodosilinea sp.]